MSAKATETGAATASSNGYLSVAAALENAPADLEELDIDDVFGGRVRIRALTAAQAAAVKQAGIVTGRGNVGVDFATLERTQFRLAVIQPPMTESDVRTLHATSGASFARVIAEIDRISGMDKEALRDAQKQFPVVG